MMATGDRIRYWVARGFFVWLCYLCAACTAGLIEWRLEKAGAPRSTTATINITVPPRAPNFGLANLSNLQYLLSTTQPVVTNETVAVHATDPGDTRVTSPHGGRSPVMAARMEAPKLTGTLAGSGHQLAVLQTGNETHILGVGEEINNYTVLAVTNYEARVRDPQGQVYNLTLGLATTTGVPMAAPPPITVIATPTPGASATPEGQLTQAELRKMLEDPTSAGSKMNIHSVKRGDDVAGYQVNYTSNDNPFARLGVQNGDILMSFQDRALKGPEDLQWAYSELRNATSLNFSIERNGKVVPLSIQLEP
jgi:type II secretion system protein C